MASPFIPLTPLALPELQARRGPASPPPAAQAQAGRSFQPLPDCSKVANSQTAGSTASGSELCAEKPTVTAERENGQITHLRIQCGCGQIIELECVY